MKSLNPSSLMLFIHPSIVKTYSRHKGLGLAKLAQSTGCSTCSGPISNTMAWLAFNRVPDQALKMVTFEVKLGHCCGRSVLFTFVWTLNDLRPMTTFGAKVENIAAESLQFVVSWLGARLYATPQFNEELTLTFYVVIKCDPRFLSFNMNARSPLTPFICMSSVVVLPKGTVFSTKAAACSFISWMSKLEGHWVSLLWRCLLYIWMGLGLLIPDMLYSWVSFVVQTLSNAPKGRTMEWAERVLTTDSHYFWEVIPYRNIHIEYVF